MSVVPDDEGADRGRTAAQDPVAGRATGTALVRLVPQPRAARPRRARPRVALWGLGMAVALGVGAVGVRAVQSGGGVAPATGLARADASAQALSRLEDEVAGLKGSLDSLRATAEAARQEDALRALRHSVDGLKQEIDQVRSSSGSTLAQLSTRIEKADRDPTPKLTEILTRLDRLDRDVGGKAPEVATQKLAEVQTRLERVEKQVSSPAATGSIPVAARATAPGPAPRPSVAPAVAAAAASAPVAATDGSPARATTAAAANPAPAAKPAVARAEPARAAQASAYALRDVYDGLALVQGRGGALREVAPGEYLPGMGEVRSIERRGRAWVVLTSRGVIE